MIGNHFYHLQSFVLPSWIMVGYGWYFLNLLEHGMFTQWLADQSLTIRCWASLVILWFGWCLMAVGHDIVDGTPRYQPPSKLSLDVGVTWGTSSWCHVNPFVIGCIPTVRVVCCYDDATKLQELLVDAQLLFFVFWPNIVVSKNRRAQNGWFITMIDG